VHAESAYLFNTTLDKFWHNQEIFYDNHDGIGSQSIIN